MISGSYTAPQSRTETDSRTTQGSNSTPASLPYSSDGFVGTLNKTTTSNNTVQTGGSAPQSTYVSNQTSSYYNSGGYSGSLSQYVYSGSYTAADSKIVVDVVGPQQSSSFPDTQNYNSGGYSGELSKNGSIVSKNEIYYDKYSVVTLQTYSEGTYSEWVEGAWSVSGPGKYDGYTFNATTGTFTGTGGNFYNVSPDGPRGKAYLISGRSITEYGTHRYGTQSRTKTSVLVNSNPVKGSLIQSNIIANDGTYPVNGRHTDGYWYVRNQKQVYSQNYSGTVTRPASDTRVYRYQGNVYTPDTRTYRTDYTANYSGTVTKPEVDTRNWQQDYSGTVYMAGNDDYYAYTVTIEYIDNSDPILDLTQTLNNQNIGLSVGNNSLKIVGKLKDVDLGDKITIKYKIGTELAGTLHTVNANGVEQSFSEVINCVGLTEGTKTIKMWAEDDKGGKTDEKILTFLMDRTSPKMDIKIN